MLVCTHWYVTTVVILPFWFASLIHNSIFMNVGSWCKLCQTGRNHILVCMCLFCVVLVVLFGAGDLIGSWFLIAQGYVMDLLGDVTSTVSSCQLSGCVCYLTICIKFSCLHAGLSDIWQCKIMHIGIIFLSYFILYHFCPCILSSFFV